jgi:primase-polymerase (primpol)-like protein
MTNFISPKFDNIPIELRKIQRWVTWNAEGKPGQKPRKVPYAPDRPNTCASSTDPTTWGSFAQAEGSYLDGNRTGVGIVLNGDGLVGVDIDHCVVDGKPSIESMAMLSKLGAGYIEMRHWPSCHWLR